MNDKFLMTTAKSIADVVSDDVIAAVAADNYHVIRGIFEPDSIRESVKKFRNSLQIDADTPSAGTRPEQIMKNFQKWSIGTRAPREQLARFFRIIYNPLWCEDIYSMHKHFSVLVALRNHITGMPQDFCKNVEEGGLYSACRIQHYPQGGGFMQAHTDHIGEANLVGSPQSKFIQLLLVLNDIGPGKDFEEGGAFIIDKNGNKILTEQNTMPGDIVVYDGRTIHGVEDIDPQKPLELSPRFGRLAAFATIYKKWN